MKPLKETVNLPQTDFPIRAGLAALEPQWLQKWEETTLYTTYKTQQEKASKTFVLHDGPPYPNGNIHLGHALNKILKDIIIKFKVMTGHKSTYIPGWDCHGLPIETQVLKELKAQGVTDPFEDTEAFRAKCAEFAKRYVAMQREDFKRLGIWGEWDHPYLTLNPDYEAKVTEAFEKLKANNLVFKGAKPIHWCTHCETALAEAEIEYADHKSPSIFVTFPLTTLSPTLAQHVPAGQTLKAVVWTTTPWTLPANVAIAAHPDLTYQLIQTEKGLLLGIHNPENPWLTTIGLETVTVVATLKGADLIGSVAQHPFINRESPLVIADYVTDTDGTGFVHIAPGHGQDDYLVGQKYNLPTIMPVDNQGKFTNEVDPNLQITGQFVFDANKTIGLKLEETGNLLKLKFISHSYPHCWRCKNPVIFRATPQWFVAVDRPMASSNKTLRQTALEQIKATKWIPEWGENRITSMIENRPDWCISRQRVWGIYIPGDKDILDVWFESGASFMSVFERLGLKETEQADLYLEGSDQHRGWFQSSLLIGCGTRGKAPYKAVLTHGFLVDEKGRKMSKSQGNVVAPEQIIKEFGADVLRWWVASADFKNDLAVSQGIIKQCSDSFSKVRNTIRFLLSNLYDFNQEKDALNYKDLNKLDQWALFELNELTKKVTQHYTDYNFHHTTQAIHHFCAVTLSAMYLDMVKDRLYCDAPQSQTRRSTQTVLFKIAQTLLSLMAPITVFTAEEAYTHFNAKNKAQSIHLTQFPTENQEWGNPELGKQFEALLKRREDIYKQLEPLRAEKVIKSFLESTVTLNAPLEGLDENDWTSFLIVSDAVVDSASSEAIQVGKTTFGKCERCWRHLPLVTENLCSRCAKVIG